MSDLNVCTFTGRLTDDPVLKEIKGGSICKFSIAVNKRVGETERTSFIPVAIFGPEAAICAKYLTKGRSVTVVGELQVARGKGENSKQTFVDLEAWRVIFGAKSKSTPGEAEAVVAKPEDNLRALLKGGR